MNIRVLITTLGTDKGPVIGQKLADELCVPFLNLSGLDASSNNIFKETKSAVIMMDSPETVETVPEQITVFLYGSKEVLKEDTCFCEQMKTSLISLNVDCLGTAGSTELLKQFAVLNSMKQRSRNRR